MAFMAFLILRATALSRSLCPVSAASLYSVGVPSSNRSYLSLLPWMANPSQSSARRQIGAKHRISGVDGSVRALREEEKRRIRFATTYTSAPKFHAASRAMCRPVCCDPMRWVFDSHYFDTNGNDYHSPHFFIARSRVRRYP